MGSTSARGARTRHLHRSFVALVATAALIGLASCTMVTPGDPGVVDVTLTVNTVGANTHPISPLIYGSNSNRNLASNKQTVLRMGGNRWTAYNWENNASNAGSDWCFQNDGYLSSSNTPADAVKPTIDQATAAGAAAIVTVPIVGYVAYDKNGGCDVRNSGANYLDTRFRRNHAAKGSALSTTPNATDADVYQDEYVNWLKTNEAGANLYFSLDNEPDLWSATHAEVHPNPVTYAELAQKNVDYAKAIKNVMPNAKVLGPVNYGFNGFESLQNAPDAGGRNFLDFYLDQMKAADTANGKRLVDYLDLHWYPEATGGGVRITGADTGAAVVAAREQAPRSLWDPSYVENSWISNPDQYNYGAIKLIPRMKDRFAAHYPGTQLAITEWNYGGGDHISGAIASADALGIFGQQGVGLATLWELNGNESYTYAAFRAFRNYDGAGATFGDTSVDASSSDVATSTVYASKFAADPNKVTIVATNKAATTKKAGIKITCAVGFSKAKVYTITAAGGANVVAQADLTAVSQNAFNYTMPAQSVSVIVPQP
jgi:hypothetical protein